MKGYWPVGWRVKTKLGELDLIVRRARTIAFVEVKWRADREAGLHAVTHNQQRRLVNAAQAWLAKRQKYATYVTRFDVVVLCPWALPLHLENIVTQD